MVKINFLCIFQVLLVSMKDMNIAKMTSVDLPLLIGIMADLFPGIETPISDYSKVNLINNLCSHVLKIVYIMYMHQEIDKGVSLYLFLCLLVILTRGLSKKKMKIPRK